MLLNFYAAATVVQSIASRLQSERLLASHLPAHSFLLPQFKALQFSCLAMRSCFSSVCVGLSCCKFISRWLFLQLLLSYVYILLLLLFVSWCIAHVNLTFVGGLIKAKAKKHNARHSIEMKQKQKGNSRNFEAEVEVLSACKRFWWLLLLLLLLLFICNALLHYEHMTAHGRRYVEQNFIYFCGFRF